MSSSRLDVRLEQAGPIPLDVEFSCGAGEVLAIFGPSGAGKTTILRTIAGLHRPAETRVDCGGRTWTDTSNGTFVPTHQRAVGYVLQDYALFPHMTALANVTAALGHVPHAERRRRAEALLKLVGLPERMAQRPNSLSGGERQRVALARALARDPAVLLLDEPFAAVDRAIRRRLQADLDALRKTLDIPVVLVTHDFDDVIRLATHVLLLDRGQRVAFGSMAELSSRPDLPWLREAVGLGSVLDASVSQVFPERGLIELAFDGGMLLAPAAAMAKGTAVRVRVPAREVILATKAPEGLSLHNALAGTVTSVGGGSATDPVVVQIAIGRSLLLAEVTKDAVSRLQIAPGVPIHALIKSVSVQIVEAP